MINSEIGMLAYSRAGHDKNQIYIIIKAEGEYVYLVDGLTRMIDKPKKKKRKHIQIMYHKDDDLIGKIENGMLVRNEDIKRIIKLYKKSKVVSNKSQLLR